MSFQLMERNAVMLEETKDTITVPAAFMIRMLACIHSLRNRRVAANGNGANANPSDPSNLDGQPEDQARAGRTRRSPPNGGPSRTDSVDEETSPADADIN